MKGVVVNVLGTARDRPRKRPRGRLARSGLPGQFTASARGVDPPGAIVGGGANPMKIGEGGRSGI